MCVCVCVCVCVLWNEISKIFIGLSWYFKMQVEVCQLLKGVHVMILLGIRIAQIASRRDMT